MLIHNTLFRMSSYDQVGCVTNIAHASDQASYKCIINTHVLNGKYRSGVHDFIVGISAGK
jgi:hypothetical protein